jgi:arabinofuranosyltransferase
LATGLSFFAVSLVRTAWLCDDAFITFRVVDNFLNGYGLVWNVGERVQVFTHPLWLALCTIAFALTGEVYYTAIFVSMAVALAGGWFLTSRLALTPAHQALCLAAVLSSKAVIDYSTSGLENPLSHLLVLAFLWQWWQLHDDGQRLQQLCLLGGLVMLNRLDLALVVAPALASAVWRAGPRAALRPLVVGFLPLLVWEVFATFYYGSPLPNTAYAKLPGAEASVAARVYQGGAYLFRTAVQDPVTLPLVGVAAVTVGQRQRRGDWPLLVGAVAYIGYIVWIGGDFMMGRFLSAPSLVSVALLGRAAWVTGPRARLFVASILVLGLTSPWEPALLSGFGYARVLSWFERATRNPLDEVPYLIVRGIADERRYYYEGLGLLKVLVRGELDHEWRSDGLELRSRGRQTVVRGSSGLVGYYAGPDVRIIDAFALGDPILARLPVDSVQSRPGHFRRVLPEGYFETVDTGGNQIRDPDLARYYEAVHTIVAADLWSGQRVRTVIRFLLGRYDPYLQRFVARTRSG